MNVTMEGISASNSKLIDEIDSNLRQQRNGNDKSQKLPHGDSGNGDSLGLSECVGDNNLSNKHLNDTETSNLTKEIVDRSQSVKDIVKSHLNNNCGNSGSSPAGEDLLRPPHTDPDSGIETSPAFNRLNSTRFEFPQMPHLIPKQESSNQSNEFCQADALHHHKKLKDNIEGPVSVLSSGDKSRIERIILCADLLQGDGNTKHLSRKSSGHPMITRQNSIDFPPLDLESFSKDDPMIDPALVGRYETSSYPPSSARSIPSVSPTCGKSCQDLAKNVIRIQDNRSDSINQPNQSNIVSNSNSQTGNSARPCTVFLQNVHTQPHFVLPVLPSQVVPVTSTYNSKYFISPQGMVPKNMMDQLTKELDRANTKLSESQSESSYFTMYFSIREEQKVKQRELETKQRELEEKQRELEEKHRELERKQCDIDSLTDRCKYLENMNEDLKRSLWLSQDPHNSDDDVDPEIEVDIQKAVSVRSLDGSDETQVKEIEDSQNTEDDILTDDVENQTALSVKSLNEKEETQVKKVYTYSSD